MCCHDKLCTGSNTGFECYHLTYRHLFPCFSCLGKSIVRVGMCVTMSGEVFQTSDYSCIVKSLQVIDHHRCRYLWVRGKGAFTNYNIVGIRIHICYRSKVNVKAVCLQILAYVVSRIVSINRVSAFSYGCHALILWNIEILIVRYTRYTPSFLVNAEQRRTIEFSNLRNIVG